MHRFQEKFDTDIYRQTDSWTEASTDKHEFIRPHLLRLKKNSFDDTFQRSNFRTVIFKIRIYCDESDSFIFRISVTLT